MNKIKDKNERFPYHHGDLKEALIKEGLKLINEEGKKGFSLRKVAARCQVSHAAPYKHFKNKEELLEAISMQVTQDFKKHLQASFEASTDGGGLSHCGKTYVKYMLEHKDSFEFMFLGDARLNVTFKNDEFSYNPNSPFEAFYEGATQALLPLIPDKAERNIMILHAWSIVHGLASLLTKEIVSYEGSYEELLDKLLACPM